MDGLTYKHIMSLFNCEFSLSVFLRVSSHTVSRLSTDEIIILRRRRQPDKDSRHFLQTYGVSLGAAFAAPLPSCV